MKLTYKTCNVFTDTPFKGNPLGVVFGGEKLTTKQMQLIAAEFNYPETTFVLPPNDSVNTANVRIFSPKLEMPFAGHPNVGTACVVAQIGELFGKKLSDSLRFEEIAGLVEISVQRDGDKVKSAELVAPGDLETGADISTEEIARCLSIDEDDIVTTTHQPTFASVGLSFTMVEVSNLQVLASCKAVVDAISALPFEHQKLHIYCKVDEAETDIRCRMFAPTINIPEDPATGSANCALAALLTHLSSEPTCEQSYRIIQGEEMGRKSLLFAKAKKDNGKITEVRIGGNSVEMMSGSLNV
jgi:trans-2,3-dihydro-3-hydroxyanthranilate isomerase